MNIPEIKQSPGAPFFGSFLRRARNELPRERRGLGQSPILNKSRIVFTHVADTTIDFDI
jgi:hypothetical protein